MTTNIQGLTRALALLCMLTGGVAHAELAVIAHPGVKLVGISKSELKDIYLGRARSLPNGTPVEALDQSSDSPARRQFMRDVLGMDERALKSYWAKLIFTGKAKPPRALDGDEAVKQAVAGNPHGIGYVQGRHVDSSVKVLLILP